jgi:hypothetical protein
MALMRTLFLESQMPRGSAGKRSVPGWAAWRQAAVGLWAIGGAVPDRHSAAMW